MISNKKTSNKMKKNLKLALVTPYPPSLTTLNEYGYHFAQHMAEKEEVESLHLITETMEEGVEYASDNEKIHFHPTWKFNSWSNSFKILKQVRQLKPDTVIINLQFLLFGDKKIAGALGLMLPVLLRIFGIKTIVLLHNILEEVDLQKAGITQNPILQKVYNLIGNVLTRFILTANIVGVTIEKYVDILKDKYNAKNVVLLPHGTFEIPEMPDFDRKEETHRVMTFGKFGTYKKVEQLIEAFQQVQETTEEPMELVIAGTDNPNATGYLQGVKETYKEVSGLEFTGYVAEEDVPGLFTESSVVVFPYTSTTGSSGVLHQAGSYGKAVVLPHLGDLGRLVEEEGYSGEFFEPDSKDSLATAIEKLIKDKSHRRKLAEQNYYAASSLSMADITDWYLIHINNLQNSQ